MERDHQSEILQSMTRSYPSIGNTENWRRSQQTIVSALCIPTALATSTKPRRQRKQQRQLGGSQNGGDKKCNFQPFISKLAEGTSANSNNSNNPDPGNSKSVMSNKPCWGSGANYNQRRGSQRKSAKAERQTGNALAAAAETTKPYMQPWMRYNLTESP